METTTELAAVNSMLATVGEAPINTLEDTGVVDAVTARSTLREVTREICTEGWTFNTDEGFPLVPEAFDPWEVKVPPSALSVVPDNVAYVVRSGRIYDTGRFSYQFEGTGPITCTVVWGLEFEDMPEVTRQYVFLRAARRFQKRALASDLIHAITEEDERRAMWVHRQSNIRVRRKSYLLDSNMVRGIANNR